MKKFFLIIVFVLTFFLSIGSVYAQTEQRTTLPVQTITLKDGTVLKGRLVGIQGDTYIIQTTQAGTLKIKTKDLVSVVEDQATGETSRNAADAPDTLSKGQLHDMQQRLLADPEMGDKLNDLLNDPEIVELLKDPELMKAAMSMDAEAIKNNPSAQKLLNHPKMKAAMEKAAQKMIIPQK